jgi:hypothetical protein
MYIIVVHDVVVRAENLKSKVEHPTISFTKPDDSLVYSLYYIFDWVVPLCYV